MFRSIKIKTILSFLLLFVVIALFSFNNTVFSTEEQINEAVVTSLDNSDVENNNVEENHTHTHEEPEIIKKDVYLLEKSDVTIDYLIDGNLFVISSGTVTIASEVGGNAFVMAPEVIIENNGIIYHSAFILAKNLIVKGQIATDLYSMSSNLNISDTGIIYRDIHSSSEIINFAGIIGRNASLSADTITLTPGATGGTTGIIYGNLDYSSPSKIANADKVVVGKTDYTQTTIEDQDENISKTISTIIIEKIKSLISYLIFVLAVWGLFKLLKSNYPSTSKQLLRKKILPILGVGLLTLIVVPIICIILLLSSFTVRISFILLLAYIILLFIATSIFVIALSELICSKYKKLNKFLSLIISIIGLWILGNVPFIGGLVSFVSLIMGLGIIVLSLFNKETNSEDENKKQEIIEKNKPDTIKEISKEDKEEKILDNLIENIEENKNEDITENKNDDNLNENDNSDLS